MIELSSVEKRFGDVVALRDVDLRVARGEVVLLTGPSGAGKTTLLRLLFAAERADHGAVRVAGREVSRLRRSAIPFLRRNIGVVFQDFKLLRDRTARDNVALAMEVLGKEPRDAGHRADVALGAVGLGPRADTKVVCLSGGEQQRVAVARAIVGAPEILLADEPTGNLDPERALDLLELFDRLRVRGVTMVLATHDPDVMAFGAARQWRRVRIDEGTVLEAPADAPIESLRDDPVLIEPIMDPDPTDRVEIDFHKAAS